VLVTHAVAATGVPLMRLPAILGGLSAFLLPFVSAAFARSVGSRWLPSLIASLVLYGLLVPNYATFAHITAGFFPDACVPLFAVLSCIAVAKLEVSGPRPATLAGFGLALFAGGLAKQAGLAALVSGVFYLALLSPMPRRTRWLAIGVAMAAALAVLAVLLAIPHCLEVTVGVMSRHPKDWKRTTVVWDHLFTNQLPAVLLCFIAFSAAAFAESQVKRRILHLGMTLAIVLGLQVLASVKSGGGGEWDSYNMEMAISLAVPLAAWAWASQLHRENSWAVVAVLVGASLFCVKALRATREKISQQCADSWQGQKKAAEELKNAGKQGDAFATVQEYWFLYSTGSRIATSPVAIWHYAVADPTLKDPTWLSGVQRAIREQRYALISTAWSAGLPEEVRTRLTQDILDNYMPTTGTTFWVPKGRP
jgi:hypothetical protein